MRSVKNQMFTDKKDNQFSTNDKENEDLPLQIQFKKTTTDDTLVFDKSMDGIKEGNKPAEDKEED